ncbi:MAG: DEAD/DEAH box helicase family protein, partial [Deltaproteobacteria bacterium]|nr:DEAD/DEAH box helicase family protein [Deltaproteobacteria bacterium]
MVVVLRSILTKYRSEARSETDMGSRFERLMVNFIKTYPLYEQYNFKKVWLWKEYPHPQAQNRIDTGIDIIAETESGQYWAVQCKFLGQNDYLNTEGIDTFFRKSGQSFETETNEKKFFDHRLLICTSYNWSKNAEDALKDQKPPCSRLSLDDLEAAPVDWEKLDKGAFGSEARLPKLSLREHQRAAVEAAREHFKTNDRGQLLMACGTGKTFTSLKIAENLTQGRGLVLFLAPSIALVGQTLKEWLAQKVHDIYAISVCSDPSISKYKKNDEDSDSTGIVDLNVPVTTDVDKILKELKFAEAKHPNWLKVIFSTYQSIEPLAEALKQGGREAALIVCDEAHRTTGVKVPDRDESYFVKVHDNSFIKASKRLYMTATPRVYSSDVKKNVKTEDSSIVLFSMDDIDQYGEEFYRLGFGEAVAKNLLTDYKVIVLTLNRLTISDNTQAELADGKKEINADDITKLIGCLNVLSKNFAYEGKILRQVDPGPMRMAVSFCQTIAKSKRISEAFNGLKERWGYLINQEPEVDEKFKLVDLKSDHIDGTMGALKRNGLMTWLKATPENTNQCRILNNVRCLSEGVDVPSLDAVLFLSPKNSQIDVVQSVGRVMRRAEGKKFGYIIIPVLVPSYVEPEDALDKNKEFSVVWSVLNALKSHDDRFQAIINKIQFNSDKPDGGGSVLIGGVAGQDDKQLAVLTPKVKGLFDDAGKDVNPLYKAIYGRLVKKVGVKQELLIWAQDVAKIAEGFKSRITKVVNEEGPHKETFEEFLNGLRKTLNPSIESADALEMLSQHLITKPVFEALFENYSFVQNNPVSKSLENIIEVLEGQGLDNDRYVLSRFYQRVKEEVAGIDNAEGRQEIIVKLYENFFKIAAAKTVEKLGIVYTPVELVDFVVESAAKVLEKEFGRKISEKNVHILDPFTGTGTFIARLIQSGLLGESLERKYLSEIHANEIVLLAYYIGAINIENAYHSLVGETSAYKPFEGICLTDTFQLYEAGQEKDPALFEKNKLLKNSERLELQKRQTITVIIGNPPYSVGQRSANDDAQNQSYPKLEQRIKETYAAKSTAMLKNSLYDSYIKAFRWASDRLNSGCGVIAFVTNVGWLDGNAMDGMRKILSEEFAKIYIFNLRGNQRTSGELSRKEGGKIFGSGSRAPIAITFLVKNSEYSGPAKIYYHETEDYLTREAKLADLAEKRNIYNPDLVWTKIIPNHVGDWLNQRGEIFEGLTLIGDKTNKDSGETFFKPVYSRGLATSRDAWCYNFSLNKLTININNTIDYYNRTVNEYKKSLSEENTKFIINYNTNKFSWDVANKKDFLKLKIYLYTNNNLIALYRPYNKQNVYYNASLNNRVYLLPKIFPTKNHKNLVICLPGPGGKNELMPLISDCIPDLHLNGDSQCFPRY